MSEIDSARGIDSPQAHGVPTVRDFFIAAEQPGEVAPWVLTYIAQNHDAQRFIECVREQAKIARLLEEGDGHTIQD